MGQSTWVNSASFLIKSIVLFSSLDYKIYCLIWLSFNFYFIYKKCARENILFFIKKKQRQKDLVISLFVQERFLLNKILPEFSHLRLKYYRVNGNNNTLHLCRLLWQVSASIGPFLLCYRNF